MGQKIYPAEPKLEYDIPKTYKATFAEEVEEAGMCH
jgi:hypothetical protein